MRIITFFMLCLILVMSIAAYSMPPNDIDGDFWNTGTQKDYDNDTYINANKILMFVTNHGSFARDLAGVFGYDYGTFYPYMSIEDIVDGSHSNSILYAAGIWMGGMVDGDIRVAVAEYSDEYVPGPMLNGTFQNDNPDFKVYKLYGDSLSDNPNADYLNWPVDQGAPLNALGQPRMRGDQMLWTVFNDADPDQHDNDAGLTDPLGIEVQQTVWAIAQEGAIEVPTLFEIPTIHSEQSVLNVRIYVVDASAFTGDDYMVVIDSVETYGPVWHLKNVTTDQFLLANQTNFSGDENYQIVDGFKAVVSEPPTGSGGWDWEGSVRPLTGVDWGGSTFFGGIGAGAEFWGSSLSDNELVAVKIRWTGDGLGQSAYCYRRDWGYNFDGLHPNQNFTVWDISVEPERQINLAFVEYFDPTDSEGQNADSLWNPGEQVDQFGEMDPLGGREYFYILKSDYSETENPNYAVDDDFENFDCAFSGWLRGRSGTDGKPDPGDILRLIPYQANSGVADTFLFTAAPVESQYCGSEGLSIYLEYKLYNKSADTINDFYFSLWSDPDLGGFTDDLAGCDTLSDLFYCYNGDNHDDQYGVMSPSVGFKILKGMVVPLPEDTAYFDMTPLPGFKNLGLTAFSKYINGIDPDNYQETYNYMQGLFKDGTPWPSGTQFAVPGDPVTSTGHIDVDPSDRRIMGSCGPVDFLPGDSQYVLIKMAIGQGPDRLASIENLKSNLNHTAYFDSTALITAIRPEPQSVRFKYTVDPFMDTILITRAGNDNVGEIDPASIVINGDQMPVSVNLLGSHPEFGGEVLQVLIDARPFLIPYGVIWDTTVQSYSISGVFMDLSPLALTGEFRIVGHISGDANSDGVCNLGDAAFILNYVFFGGAAPRMVELGDINGDGSVNVGDAGYLIAYIFHDGPPPVSP